MKKDQLVNPRRSANQKQNKYKEKQPQSNCRNPKGNSFKQPEGKNDTSQKTWIISRNKGGQNWWLTFVKQM